MYRELTPLPDDPLRVDAWWTVSSAGARAMRVLPDGCMDIVFDRAAGRAVVVGAMTRAHVDDRDSAELFGVRFLPGAAPFEVPARLFTDASVDLAELWGPAGAALAERVAEARDADQARARVHAALAGRRRGDRRVRAAVAALAGGCSVRAAADAVELGERQLERLFLQHVGLGPQRFARIARLRRILPHLGADLATVAVVGGFVDPSHVVREVRALSGLAPGALAAERAGAG